MPGVSITGARLIHTFNLGRAHGLGKHRGAISDEQAVAFSRLLYFAQIVYALGPPTFKLSLLCLYRRIFPSPRFHRVIYVIGAIVVASGTVAFIMSIFNCVPISAFWTRQGRCLDIKKLSLGYAIVNITTDFAVWTMPIPSVWKIQLPTMQRVSLCFIFLLGLLYVQCPSTIPTLLFIFVAYLYTK